MTQEKTLETYSQNQLQILTAIKAVQVAFQLSE